MSDAPVDVLVIDEAGQLALADAVVASRSARNVILLGDPLQLAQVSKATHPDGAGASVLEHVLGEDATISAERGVFLAETRRMHPAICGFISSQFYEGRLVSHVGCCGPEHRRRRAGIGVDRGPSRGKIHRVTGGGRVGERAPSSTCSVRNGPTATVRRSQLSAADFMVVAPYNDQVHLVREVLAGDDRTAAVRGGHGGQVPRG